MTKNLKFKTKKELITIIQDLELQLDNSSNRILNPGDKRSAGKPQMNLAETTTALGFALNTIASLEEKLRQTKTHLIEVSSNTKEFYKIPGNPLSLTMPEVTFITAGQKLQAVKMIKERLNIGLKESKDLMDAYCIAYKIK